MWWEESECCLAVEGVGVVGGGNVVVVEEQVRCAALSGHHQQGGLGERRVLGDPGRPPQPPHRDTHEATPGCAGEVTGFNHQELSNSKHNSTWGYVMYFKLAER